MTKVLLMAAAIGLTVTSAGACNSQKSVQANVDQTTVASVVTSDKAQMSTPIADAESTQIAPEAKSE